MYETLIFVALDDRLPMWVLFRWTALSDGAE